LRKRSIHSDKGLLGHLLDLGEQVIPFVDFFNRTIGKEYDLLTSVFAFWINILEVWVLFVVPFYLAKYVAIVIAFVPVYATLFNGVTHAITRIALRSYNPGPYTALALFLPWGIFLLNYFNAITRSNLLFNGVGLLIGIIMHALIVACALRRRSKLRSHSQRGT
jgi:hypothetical protein